jgi:hypothetical protein
MIEGALAMHRSWLPKSALVGLALLTVAGVTLGEDLARPARVADLDQAGPASSVNPKVRPGKLRWHPGFAAACDAARQSGKPVLLFQMMGRLDEQFC